MADEINTNEAGSHVQTGHNIFICKCKANLVLKFLKFGREERCEKYTKRLSPFYYDLVRRPYDKLDTGLQYTTILLSSLNTQKELHLPTSNYSRSKFEKGNSGNGSF